MESDLKWPKKGDHPFPQALADPHSSTWCSLHWLANAELAGTYLAQAFKESADRIVTSIAEENSRMPADKFFMPVAYLYRHSLELKMKEIIHLGRELYNLDEDELEEQLRSHKLSKLWMTTRQVLLERWPEASKTELNATERIIIEFHRIDKSGQSLRYHRDLGGKPTAGRLPRGAKLDHLKDVCEGVFNFLDGCQYGLEHALEALNDMRHEYSPEM